MSGEGRYRPTREERFGTTAMPIDSTSRSIDANQRMVSRAPATSTGPAAPAQPKERVSSPLAGINVVARMKVIASRLGSEAQEKPKDESSILDMLSKVLISEAHAEYVDMPPVPLRGLMAHLMISGQLCVRNFPLLPDLTLEKLMEKAADAGLPMKRVRKSDAQMRPDLTRLTTMEFWDIKSALSAQFPTDDAILQLNAYSKVFKPGGRLVGLPGSFSHKIAKVPIRCSYKLHSAGVISYDAEFDPTNLLKRLGRKVVEEFIRDMKEAVKQLSKRTQELVGDPLFLEVLLAIAICVLIAMYWGTVLAAFAAIAAAVVELLEFGAAALILI